MTKFGNSSVSVREVIITSIFGGLIPTFTEVTEENLVGVGGLFAPSLILNKIKGMNLVILRLSGCPRIGLVNESNIDILQKTSMTR